MKKLILSLLMFAPLAQATSLASIYNGDHFNMNGVRLAQGADNPNEFYVLPTYFYLDSGRFYDRKLKKYVDNPGFNHQVQTDAQGNKYSVYTFSLRLAEPSDYELVFASQKLWLNKDTRTAEVKGLAPICAVDVKVPGFESGEKIGGSASNPQATFIQYSVQSSSVCGLPLDLTEMKVVYKVPFSLEPGVAKRLKSEEGLEVPNLELLHPYKYKDTVSLEIDAEIAVETLKSLVGFQGQYKEVQGAVQSAVKRMSTAIKSSQKIDRDCQNPDRTTCDRFEERAADLVAKTFLIFTPVPNQADSNQLVIADNDKQAGTFKINLAYDRDIAKKVGKVSFDLSDTVYSQVRSQARVLIAAPNTKREYFHPEVQALLE